MAKIQKTTSAERQAISRRSVLQLADRPSEYGQKPSDIKNAIAMPVFGEQNSALAVLDRVVDDLNTLLNGDTTSDPALQTTAQALIGAINELRAKLTSAEAGSYTELQTTAQTVLEAVNELKNDLDAETTGRQQDVSTLQEQIGAEESSRVTNDDYLQGQIGDLEYALQEAVSDLQSAIASAVAPKVDKLTGLEVPSVYVGNPNGTQSSLPVKEAAQGGSIPVRDANANIRVGDATESGHAVNLGMARTLIQEQIGRVYKPAGSISFAELINTVDLDESNLGNIYNIRNAFTTTSDFMEGAGVSYPEGTNVGVVQDGVNYYFDVFVGQNDLSGYAYLEAESNSFSGDMEVGGDLQVYGDLLNINGHTYINTDDQATAAEMAEILAVLS